MKKYKERQKRKSTITPPKKHSLTGEIIILIIGLIAGIILLCWFLNTVFLERYYIKVKQDLLLEGFEMMDAAGESGILETSGFDVDFDNFCANGNVTVMVFKADWTVVRSSISDIDRMLMEFGDILFNNRTGVEVLLQEENYVLLRKTDTRLDSEYLVLQGTLSNGDQILMRSALESIRESVKISNRFLAYIGILAIVIGAMLTILVSKRITTPLLELTDISKRMTELDFDAKYRPKKKRRNEIDELGDHMNRLSHTLEQTISELKSANNQLLVDIEQKTQIDNRRKEFLSNVSHELKTPLALIQGYAEGLKECINDDEESRNFYCEVIMDEADKMNRMVKKLLTLNQLESGGETVTMERFDLTELIQGVLHASEILIKQNQIRVTEAPAEPVSVWADEFLAEEIITNYLSNAIHHADGSREIAIRYVRRENVIRVCVFNTGKQIPEAELEKIWGKFYKVDKARTREYGGSGIGLSIVKAAVESMHRECGVENREDGVEFWFELDAEKC